MDQIDRQATYTGTKEVSAPLRFDVARLEAYLAANAKGFKGPLTVVMATKGYPGSYGRGSVIGGLDVAAALEGIEIFHAGTKAEGGQITANGGRVLNICGIGRSVAEAQARAYAAVDKIDWPEGFCRRDIGYLAIGRE